MPRRLERDEFSSLRDDAIRARGIGEGHHAIRVTDIEGVADERHPERLVQSLHERLARFGDAVLVFIAQQADAVCADAKRVGAPHRRLHCVVKYAPGRACDLRRLGDQDVAIGKYVDPARMVQAGRKRVDLESRRRCWLLPIAPPSRCRHLERRDRALRLCRWNRRSVAPGGLRCRALQPAPRQRGSADQGDDARKNAGKTHRTTSLNAHTLSNTGAIWTFRRGLPSYIRKRRTQRQVRPTIIFNEPSKNGCIRNDRSADPSFPIPDRWQVRTLRQRST
jgi:hypothetical protein